VTADDLLDAPDAGADTAAGVLAWFVDDGGGYSAEARGVARRRLRACGFPWAEHLVDDVVADAVTNVLRRLRSPNPLEVENPAAYGTTVIRHVVDHLSRGEEVPVEDVELAADHTRAAESPEPAVDPSLVDDVRVAVERAGGPPWLIAATLAYLALEMHPDHVPAGAPAPRAGSRSDQALAWPALWFAGRRDCFPEGGDDPRRKARSRFLGRVLDLRSSVYASVAARRAALSADDVTRTVGPDRGRSDREEGDRV
jgi:hypothetical protein